jgi:DNA polymerase IIIc chi subunit
VAEIRFYTLAETGGPQRLKQVCALVEKAFRDGERVLVIEVVDADPGIRAAGRARFRYYREHGVTPRHLELKAS